MEKTTFLVPIVRAVNIPVEIERFLGESLLIELGVFNVPYWLKNVLTCYI